MARVELHIGGSPTGREAEIRRAALMETSASLLDRLAATPSDVDWRRLVNLYAPLLAAWLARAGVPAHDRDDLSQEVLMVVVKEVAGFERGRPGAFRAWLRTIL